MFVAVLVTGYEYHDDYIETGRASVQCSEDAYKFGLAEEEVDELAMTILDWWGEDYDGWWRVESIERVLVEVAA